MAPAMSMVVEGRGEDEQQESQYQKGVRHLCESGITKVPKKYILPISDRPNSIKDDQNSQNPSINLPVIDFSELQGPNRSQVLSSLAKACKEYGFFQLVNHGIATKAIVDMLRVAKQFFELPFDERAKYMSKDMYSAVRYGTSFNQNKDGVFCWRDFLKLKCDSLLETLPLWPSSPENFREAAVNYSKQQKKLYEMLLGATFQSLGLAEESKENNENDGLEEFEGGSQLLVVNCYPACPEPDLTLGMPPHSDYGMLTLLLQDEVKGLQIQHNGKWVTVEPIPNSFVVNVGDQLEIFSNGRYKSVVHRVLANPEKFRISIASLHSQPLNVIVRPSPKLGPRLYKDTDFASFLKYLTSQETKCKSFLESRMLT